MATTEVILSAGRTISSVLVSVRANGNVEIWSCDYDDNDDGDDGDSKESGNVAYVSSSGVLIHAQTLLQRWSCWRFSVEEPDDDVVSAACGS